MKYLLFIFLVAFLRYIFDFLDINDNIVKPNNSNKYIKIEYYSNGQKIPLSFTKEYRIVFNSFLNKKLSITEIELKYIDLIANNQELVRTTLSLDSKIESEFIYNKKMFFLAKEYLINESIYLNNLN